MSGSPEIVVPTKPHHRMSTKQRLLFFLTAWLIVLMPFLFWWNTWFGRQLSDKKLIEEQTVDVESKVEERPQMSLRDQIEADHGSPAAPLAVGSRQ